MNVWVEMSHDGQVAQRVALFDCTALLLGTGRAEDTLDLLRIDDASDVRVGDHGVGEGVSRFEGSRGGECAVQGSKFLKCIL